MYCVFIRSACNENKVAESFLLIANVRKWCDAINSTQLNSFRTKAHHVFTSWETRWFNYKCNRQRREDLASYIWLIDLRNHWNDNRFIHMHKPFHCSIFTFLPFNFFIQFDFFFSRSFSLRNCCFYSPTLKPHFVNLSH